MNLDPLKSILTLVAENKRTVCVFDLDSTLFNVSTRTQQILSEFADLHKPELKNVQILHTDWGLKEALNRAGYDYEQNPDLHGLLRDFWVERFFSNEYLQYDVPYPGAVAYVQKLHQAGCEIHFLTGRDIKRMGLGTLAVLKKWGFPARGDNLHLKPDRSQDDHKFKIDWMLHHFPHKENESLYFFENEPVNINALGKLRTDVKIVYMDTTHSRQESVTVSVVKITDFKIKDTP